MMTGCPCRAPRTGRTIGARVARYRSSTARTVVADTNGASTTVSMGRTMTAVRAEALTASASRGEASVANPAPARGITPVPLSRYVGEWTYPAVGAHYHGAQPESVDLVIREENGRASGTLSARFKLPPGDAAGSPVVSFDFTGAFQNSRSQTFSVTTGSGAPGTLELIPGPAFNLLEVNFNTDEKSGTVRQANFLLLKK